jgi:RNA polymerase sigma-70 factor (ECF subfamily)
MLGAARRILRDEAEAEDAVQEAFVSAFRAIGSFDGRAALGTWLHRITINAALQRLRRRRNRRETSIDDLMPTFVNGYHAGPVPAWHDVTDVGVAGIEERAALWQAIDALPDDFRTVVILRDVEGLASREVAESLGITDALVRQRLHRGRQALLKLLGPTMEDGS